MRAPIIDDCRFLIDGFCKGFNSNYNRESNVVSHELAKLRCSCNPWAVWLDSPPSSIVILLVDDITII